MNPICGAGPGKLNDPVDSSGLKRFTVVILGASLQSPNRGVSALSAGTITAILHSCPDARIILLDYGFTPAVYGMRYSGKEYFVELVNIRFTKKFYLKNSIIRLLLIAFFSRLFGSASFSRCQFDRNEYLQCIAGADVVAAMSGGDSFSDIYGFRRLVYVSLPQILAILMKKKLVLLPQTLGPFSGTIAKAFARFVLKRAEMVYSRDRESFEAVRGLLGADFSRLRFSHDVGFILEPYLAERRKPKWLPNAGGSSRLVGINISGILHMGGYTLNNMFNLKADYRELVRELIRRFVIVHGTRVVLVPHVYAKDIDSEGDQFVCRKIYSELSRELGPALHLVDREYDHHELKAIIGQCDFFLGSRMHACIAALSQCIPAVGLSYSRKFRGVFESVGVEEMVVDLRRNDCRSVLDTVDRLYMNRDKTRKILESIIPAARADVFKLFDNIRN